MKIFKFLARKKFTANTETGPVTIDKGCVFEASVQAFVQEGIEMFKLNVEGSNEPTIIPCLFAKFHETTTV